MNVREFIDILAKLPQEKEVTVFWDGSVMGVVEGIVNDDNEIVIIGDWSIYRDGTYREYEENKIVFG